MEARCFRAKRSHAAVAAVSHVASLVVNRAPTETAIAVAVEMAVIEMPAVVADVTVTVTTAHSASAARLGWIRLRLFFRQ
jgi:hypothetical protein